MERKGKGGLLLLAQKEKHVCRRGPSLHLLPTGRRVDDAACNAALAAGVRRVAAAVVQCTALGSAVPKNPLLADARFMGTKRNPPTSRAGPPFQRRFSL